MSFRVVVIGTSGHVEFIETAKTVTPLMLLHEVHKEYGWLCCNFLPIGSEYNRDWVKRLWRSAKNHVVLQTHESIAQTWELSILL